jgi:hypothetical protein
MKFSFPSIDQVAESILQILKRFPFVILVSVIGTLAAILFADLPYNAEHDYPMLYKTIFVSALGISWMFAIATFTEQKSWKTAAKWGVRASGMILLLLYFFLLGDNLSEGPYASWYRLGLFLIASHLLVAFAPFIGSFKLDQFWEYNKVLFLRILLSVLYSGALQIGLSIALVSIDQLLGIDIDGETYFQLFLFLGGIFNTCFFLAGIPPKDAISESSLSFPKGLRLFSQYVLIPLVTVYIIILYLYLAKIVIQWELPNGWVSNLVLSFSIAGILSLLLLYPIRNSEDFKWVHIYSRGYYIALIPLIGLLMVSIWVRISEYGVTINRYYVATLGVWLTGIVIYFIISKTRSIKVIPVSLCVIAVLVSFGPLGAFAVSERSQLGRFEKILSQNEMLNEAGIIQQVKEEISWEDRKELSSVVDYITENHGYQSFQKYFVRNVETVVNDTTQKDSLSPATYQTDSQKILEEMGVDYVSKWATEDGGSISDTYYEFSYSGDEMVSISEFDVVIPSIVLWPGETDMRFEYENKVWYLLNQKEDYQLVLTQLSEKKDIKIQYLELKEDLIEKYGYRNNSVSFSDMSVVSENENLKVLCLFEFISGNQSISRIRLSLYIKEKE